MQHSVTSHYSCMVGLTLILVPSKKAPSRARALYRENTSVSSTEAYILSKGLLGMEEWDAAGTPAVTRMMTWNTSPQPLFSKNVFNTSSEWDRVS